MRLFRSLAILILGWMIFSSDLWGQTKKREMRGVWVATVSNIDWPSQKDNSEAQKMELLMMLDSLKYNNINTIVFQARPMADAFYESSIEPWSSFLTGKQGKAPSDYYDPLAFLIEEAHIRCMEVHVWINPYRVTNTESTQGLVYNHIFYQKPYLFVKYGGRFFFDPGLPETRDYLVRVVSDIVTRYDLDAVHMDDYFYPYRVAGSEFPDQRTFAKYSRGIFDKEDWRRDNVDLIISRLHDTIKVLKPWVEFGISPFGVWRNNTRDSRGSATKGGCSNYDDLYADILKWLENGWIDYVVPQLYWELGHNLADYSVLAPWWSEHTYGRKLYTGLYASGLEINKGRKWQLPNELIRQLNYNSSFAEIEGAFFYSARYFLKNVQGLQDSLRASFYRYPALPPECKGVERASFPPPRNVRIVEGDLTSFLLWDKMGGKDGRQVVYYVVYVFSRSGIKGDIENPANILIVTSDNQVDLLNYPFLQHGVYTFIVTAVNRYRQESRPSIPVEKR